jgi:dTDP-glucose 4,6-dehydratase
MSFLPTRLLVTGGAGFIGSAAVRLLLERAGADARLVVLDALTYAGHRINLEEVASDPRFAFVQGDICDTQLVTQMFATHGFDAVVHLAAESHVDRSIESAAEFVRTNVTGTFTLLDAARRAWQGRGDVRFVHVSTDEVFGALGETGVFTETTPYAPNSPYAASKAASDLLVRSYGKTYGLPVIITNCCNNYGPRQLPEKLIPLMITNAATGKPLPVYGEGTQVREWIHVEDHADALWAALTRGAPGESYLFGTGEEFANRDIVELIANSIDAHLGHELGTARKLITFVTDRKGHDFRYAIDSTKARRELGWTPRKTFREHLQQTISWYLANGPWCKLVSTAEHERFQAAYYAKDAR